MSTSSPSRAEDGAGGHVESTARALTDAGAPPAAPATSPVCRRTAPVAAGEGEEGHRRTVTRLFHRLLGTPPSLAAAACSSPAVSADGGAGAAMRRQVKVAVVGEAESGRTTLCASLGHSAERATKHPLVVSGAAAALGMDASVFSTQTYDVKEVDEYLVAGDTLTPVTDRLQRQPQTCRVEATIVDSGPAPLSSGCGTWKLAEADLVLLCFPLLGIKQVMVVAEAQAEPEPPAVAHVGVSSGKARPAKATQAFIHSGELKLLGRLLALISSRCRTPDTLPFAPAPAIVVVGTLQDSLRDASVAATHTILGALRRVCDRLTRQSPTLLRVTDVVAVSARHGTCVLMADTKLSTLQAWWGRALRATPSSMSASSSAPSGVLLDTGAVLRLDDTRAASLFIDFITELKARRRVWLLPLPRLWRVAYALGMQVREQLSLVLRHMETAGDVLLLGRALGDVDEGAPLDDWDCAKETVCMCPALLPASYAILSVYTDWVARRQRRHLRACLRGVDLQECGAADPAALAARGRFNAPLLQRLATALQLRRTPAKEAAEVLTAVLVGADLAYITSASDREVEGVIEGGVAAASPQSQSQPQPQPQSTTVHSDPLQPPSPTRTGSSSVSVGHSPSNSGPYGAPAASASAHGIAAALASATMSSASSFADDRGTPAPSPTAYGGVQDTERAGPVDGSAYTRRQNITVAELTSLFLLGELTSSSSEPSTAAPRTDVDAAAAPLPAVHLVVPSLQPRVVCPAQLVDRVTDASTTLAASSCRSIATVQLQMRVDPLPPDLVLALTCRIGGLSHRVARSYTDAALFACHVGLQCTADPEHRVASPPNGCVFLHCEAATHIELSPPPTPLLHLILFANSRVQLSSLERVVCRELQMFLRQRMPGVALSPAPETRSAARVAPLASFSCATVADLLHTLLEEGE
ncbi:hypothetical protein NESM_000319100 [Novymonas esmeraldas]|uniref:Uncharacterized protein n=1 Tax=Novymonas esmeraldas TaxID=1808958 RepID=A0AAW0EKC9_9TRYP